MSRAIVNVATGRYIWGQRRLRNRFSGVPGMPGYFWERLPPGCPAHEEIPYAMKAHALSIVATEWKVDTLLWCDASIVPGPRPLKDLWEKIEDEGYWIANNGFDNYTWTADSAYGDLFPPAHNERVAEWRFGIWCKSVRALNRKIPHVVATAFGLSMRQPIGRNILAEYFRLASQTKAFCGPWFNSNYQGPVEAWRNRPGAQPCGPADVAGHRHDQSCLSVIAWRLGCKLTNCPEWFAYRGNETDATCLVADGNF